MKGPRRHAAFLAYLLPVLGWLYVFFFFRDDEFAVYHTKQAIMLTVVVVATPVLWAIFAWAMLWIPSAGPIIAAATFTMVILLFIAAAFIWVIGLGNAARARLKPLPIFGSWALRFMG